MWGGDWNGRRGSPGDAGPIPVKGRQASCGWTVLKLPRKRSTWSTSLSTKAQPVQQIFFRAVLLATFDERDCIIQS